MKERGGEWSKAWARWLVSKEEVERVRREVERAKRLASVEEWGRQFEALAQREGVRPQPESVTKDELAHMPVMGTVH